MRRRLTRRLGKGGRMALLAAGVLLVSANPAAAEAGSGESTGGFTTFTTNDRDIEVPLCLPVTAATVELDNLGSFTATPVGGTPEAYVGQTHAVITATEDYYFSPAGVFENATCTLPKAVPVTISVADAGTPVEGDSVECTGSGLYNRTGENAEVVSTPGTTTCSVNGSAPVSVVLSFEGSQQPCLPDPLPQPCVDTSAGGQPIHTEWVGTYSET